MSDVRKQAIINVNNKFIQFIYDYQNKLNMFDLCQNTLITIDNIQQHKTIKWNWEGLSLNRGICILDIINNHNLPWVWSHISSRLDVNTDIINTYPELPWDFVSFSKNPNISLAFIKKHLAKFLNNPESIYNISHLIDQEILLDNINNYWNWSELSKNPNITPEFIKKYPQLPWQLTVIENKNMTLDELPLFIKSYIQAPPQYNSIKLNNQMLSKLKFEKDIEKEMQNIEFNRFIGTIDYII